LKIAHEARHERTRLRRSKHLVPESSVLYRSPGHRGFASYLIQPEQGATVELMTLPGQPCCEVGTYRD